MSYFLTEEQRLIKNIAREFAQNEVKPKTAQIDKSGEFPMDLWKRCAELGFTGICIPEALGGLGADVTTEMVVMEELGRQCPTLALIVDAHMYAVSHDCFIRDGRAETKVRDSLRQRRKNMCPIQHGSGRFNQL